MAIGRATKLVVFFVSAVSVLSLSFSPRTAKAVAVVKANNADNLNLTTSWVGGVVPTGLDVATWNSTVAGANSTILGADLSWGGIAVTNPGGLVTIGAGNTLTLGTSGIDLSAATQGLTISSGLTLGSGGQAWNVATGQTLTLNTGTFTRSAGATLLVDKSTNTGTVATTNITNTATTPAPGIIGPWAVVSSAGTATQNTAAGYNYATVSGGNVVAYTTATIAAGFGGGFTATVNYDVTVGGTFDRGVSPSLNTARIVATTVTNYNANAGAANSAGGYLTAGVGGTLNLGGAGFVQPAAATDELVLTAVAAPINVTAVIRNNGADAGTMTIAGTNTVTFSGNNTYTGATNVTGSSLIVSGAGSINSSSGININGVGARYSHTSSVASTRSITVTRGSVDGTGTIAAVTVGNGTGGNVTNGNNGASGSLTMSSLTFGGAATATPRYSGSAGIVITGALTTTPANGQVTVNPTLAGGGWSNGINNLISYGSFNGGAGSISHFTLGTISGLNARQSSGGLLLNGNNVALQVNGDSVVWSGAGGGTWQTAANGNNTGPNNWALLAGQTATNFWAGDLVEFNDTYNVGGGPTAPTTTTATISGGVSPGRVTFNNSTQNYTIDTSDATGIGGTAAVVKNGTGTATINTSNSYSGLTTINAGTLTLNGTNTTSGGTTLNGGTLNIGNNSALGTGAFTTGAGGAKIIDATGAARTLTTALPQFWNGDFTFTGSFDLDMGNAAVTAGGAGTDRTVTVSAGTLSVGELRTAAGLGFSKQGAGTLVLSSSGAALADGSIINGTLNVAAGTLQMNRAGTSGATSGDVTATGLTGSGTIVNGAADIRWLFVNPATGQSTTFNGTLANGPGGALGLNKQGAGTLILAGPSSYTDVTTLAGGTLVAANTAALGTTFRLNVTASGTTFEYRTDGGDNVVPLGLGSTNTVTIVSNRATAGAAVDRTMTVPALNGLGGGTITFTSGANVTSGTGRITFTQVGLGAGGVNTTTFNPTGVNLTLGDVSKFNNNVSQTIGLGGTTSDNRVTGVISNGAVLLGANNISVAKTGTSTWILSGSNTYTGTTTVDGGGTLDYSGAHGGNGTFTVSGAGSILRFSGSKTGNGNITVNAGTTLAESSTGQIEFDITNGGLTAGRVLGTGIVDFDGLFRLDTTTLTDTSGVWNLVDVANLTESFDPTTFGLQFTTGGSFTPAGGGIYTNSSGAGWQFNTSTGFLTLGGAVLEVWNSDTNFTFSNNANWQDNSAPAAGATLLFGSVITADRTITLDVPASVSGVTFDSAGPDYTIAGPSALTLTGNANVSVNTGGSHTISAVIQGTVGLTKSGSGALFLTADNSYTGTTSVQAGSLGLRTVGAVDGAAAISAGADITFWGNNAGGGYVGSFGGAISGAGNITLEDDADVTLTAANSYGGVTTLWDESILTLSGSGTAGSGDGTAATRTVVNQGAKLSLAGATAGTENLELPGRNNDLIHVTSSGTSSLAGNIVGLVGGNNYNFESTSGTLTYSGTLSTPDTGVRNIVFSGAGNFNVTGRISDAVVDANGVLTGGASTSVTNSVIKRGAGTLTIATATTNINHFWLGTTTIEGGTLEVISDGANAGELRSSTIAVRASTIFDVDHFANYSIQSGQDLSGAGDVHAQTLSIFGDSLWSPGDSVGTMTLHGAGGSGDGNVYLGSDFIDAAGARGGLSFELGSATTVGGGVNDLITGVGNLTLDVQQYDDSFTPLGTDSPIEVIINPVQGSLAGGGAGTYRLINYSGSLTPIANTAVSFSVQLVGGAGATRQSFAVSLATANQVNLVVSGAAQTYNWTGATDGNWAVGSIANWSSSDTFYFDLDNITFTDLANDRTTVAIAPATVTPGSITFSNNVDNYTFTGGGIQTVGSNGMTLNANADVVLANTGNSLGGNLSIASTATLRFGDGVSTGTSTLGGTASNSGLLALSSGTLNISGAVTNSGSLTNAAAMNLTGSINNSGSITVTGGTLNATGTISGAGSITTTGGAAIMSGNNTGYTGQINVNGGTVEINNVNGLGTTAGSTVVAEGGNLRSNGDAFTVNEPITLNGGALAAGGGGPAAVVFAGNITLGAGESNFQLDGGTGDDGMNVSGNIAGSSGGTLVVGVDGGSRLLVTGAIQHNGSLTKNSNGEIELQGANTYSGGTTHNNGLMDVEGLSATLGTGNVAVTGGTLEISTGVANAIFNSASLAISGTGLVNLGAGINDFIGGLSLGGVLQAAGTYGSTASGAANQNNTWFTAGSTGILTVGLIGDYNNDGTVDTADFVVWSKTNINGAQGYIDWKTNFGNSIPGAGGGLGGSDNGDGSVPEPGTCVLVLLSALALVSCRGRRW